MKMSFTVKRSLWARGGDQLNFLLGNDGKMCCLGFFCKALGATDDQIRRRGTPQSVNDPALQDAIKSLNLNDALWAWAINYNDDPCYTDANRERCLTREFANRDIEILFVD